MVFSFGCRLNGGPTIKLKFAAPSSAPFDFQELQHAEHKCFYMMDVAQESKGYLHQIQQIDCFWDTYSALDPEYLSAPDMFHVALVGPKGVLPCVLGQLTCVSPTSSSGATTFQPWMTHLQPTAKVYLCVYHITPNPAWRSAGKVFDTVAKQLVHKWRVAFMSHIGQMMQSGAMDQNATFTDEQVRSLMQLLVQHVHGHIEADIDEASMGVQRVRLLD